jgi:hypothetical protein
MSTQHSASSNSTQFYTQSTAGSQFNSDENFMKQARIVNLSDMKKLKLVWSCFCDSISRHMNHIHHLTNIFHSIQDTYCVTVVTADHIRVTNQGWFFYACPDCGLKADGKEPPFVCKKGHQTNNPLIKYVSYINICHQLHYNSHNSYTLPAHILIP